MYFALIDLNFTSLLPLTFSRPVSFLRIGADRIIDKWTDALGERPHIFTSAHLHTIFPQGTADEGILINSSALPTAALTQRIRQLPKGHMLAFEGEMIAYHCDRDMALMLQEEISQKRKPKTVDLTPHREVLVERVHLVRRPSDLFALNGEILQSDLLRITGNTRTIAFPKYVTTLGEHIFVEEGAVLRPCVLNAETGPIFIAKGAEIMEGSMVRGPFYLGEDSVLKMGSKIYGPTSIGAHCKVGGEVSNSIIDDYSNKGHDGFLGNSAIGSWCNLGADTNTSNLKNNYGAVRVWDYVSEQMADTGLQFHGLVMGDHSKAGINTMFNTGTVVGVCCNIYGGGFPKKFVPSFSWGSSDGFIDFDLEKACEMATAMMARREKIFTQADRDLFNAVFNMEARWRN